MVVAGIGRLYDGGMVQVDNQAVVAVFGHSKADAANYAQAEQVGHVLGRNGYGVVCGGYGGAMEAVCKGVVQVGSVAVGVTCRAFSGRPNPFLTRVVETDTLPQRVATLLEEATAGFVVLPGGTGTLVELAMCWELMNKRFLSERPLVCVGLFWRPVAELVVGIQPQAEGRVRFVAEPAELAGVFPPRRRLENGERA